MKFLGLETIVGVYTEELTSLKVGCLKQVKIYYSRTEFDGDSPIKEWLEENTFPSGMMIYKLGKIILKF